MLILSEFFKSSMASSSSTTIVTARSRVRRRQCDGTGTTWPERRLEYFGHKVVMPGIDPVTRPEPELGVRAASFGAVN